jgi:hypothetical protein
MKVDWIILAEGLGTDAKGAVTAIGVDQSVLMAPELPTRTKRAILVRLVESEGDDLTPGTTLRFTMSATSPSGKVLSAQTGEVQLGPKLFTELPGTVTLPAEVQLLVSEYGTHTVGVVVEQPRGDDLSASTPLYVVAPRSNTDEPVAEGPAGTSD